MKKKKVRKKEGCRTRWSTQWKNLHGKWAADLVPRGLGRIRIEKWTCVRLRDSGSDLHTMVSGQLFSEDRHLLREVVILLIIK